MWQFCLPNDFPSFPLPSHISTEGFKFLYIFTNTCCFKYAGCGLNGCGFHRLMYLNASSQGTALLEDKALLEEVWSWRKCVTVGLGFEVSYTQATPSVAHSPLLLPLDQDIGLLAPPAPCLPGCCHASRHDDNGLNL